jgi:uncharacterized protein (TIGR04141 family)
MTRNVSESHKMSVDLTLNLLIERISSLDEVIPPEKRGLTEFQQVPLREGFTDRDSLSCWIKKNAPKPTDWSAWLEEGFDFGDKRPKSQSCGCVILIRSEQRIFAASFGTGRHAVPEDLIECDFGLTVALNEVNPRQLRTLVTKTIDVKTRQRDTKKAGGAEVPEFALDLDVEWLRAAEGKAGRADCNVVVGSDSLHLTGWRRSLQDLANACGEFLKVFRQGVPEVFKFAESVKPVPENDPIHTRLEGDLQAAIQLRYFEQISLGIGPATARIARRCLLTYDRRSWSIPGLDDESLQQGLDRLSDYDPYFDATRARIRLFDADGENFFNKSLISLLQMEIDRDGDSYIRVEKRWFRCREDYVARVKDRVAEFENLTETLALPAWSRKTYPEELDYNSHVADAKGWLLQDQVPFHSSGGENLEACDLLTPQNDFIHVKDGADSSKLSHLFSQASGSAVLLRRHKPFFDEMRTRHEKKWSGSKFEEGGKSRIVLAIARPPGRELFGKMLLSRINVLEHARRIQGQGFDFAISRVDLE